jgi:hypothetical protein
VINSILLKIIFVTRTIHSKKHNTKYFARLIRFLNLLFRAFLNRNTHKIPTFQTESDILTIDFNHDFEEFKIVITEYYNLQIFTSSHLHIFTSSQIFNSVFRISSIISISISILFYLFLIKLQFLTDI